jgi:serine/threonine protein kinase
VTVKCPKCQAENPEDTNYCGKCATPLPSSKEMPVSQTETLRTPIGGLTRGSIFAGRYEIVEELGHGGMGRVYKAEDTKLKRTVALKFLAPELTRNPEAKARFILEAQAASALSHPNICTVYEIDEYNNQMFIVMAYVEGKSLREKIAQGPLKLEEALGLAAQIADGLHEAHEKGIIHRDIKSSNIMITAKGQAVVMDFGIAKFAGETKITHTGTTMGTVAYMSPEQARGEKVDHRTDIWSLGVVLYEMVIGQLPFKGNHEQALIYSILNEAPEPMTALRTGVPMELERIVAKALMKEPALRYQHADEIATDLKSLKSLSATKFKTPTPYKVIIPSRRGVFLEKAKVWGGAILIAVFSALVTFVISWNLRPRASQAPISVKRAIINLKQNESLGGTNYGYNFVISPDGKNLVYQATSDNIARLYLRPMDQYDSTPLPGTENAENPFFSSDSRWIGFFSSGTLKKERIGGASPIFICRGTPQPEGATWGANDSIIFYSANRGLVKVSASGGAPQELTTPDGKKNESSHSYPQILPGGKTVLFQISYSGGGRSNRIAALSLETLKWKVILDEEGYYPFYLASGHIVFTQAGRLMAVPFDLGRLEVSGPPFALAEEALIAGDKPINLSFSNEGTMAYVPQASENERNQLAWVDQKGQATLLGNELISISHPRIAPDGKRIALTSNSSLYVYDIESQTLNRLTFKGGVNYPVWRPDGKALAFTAPWRNYDLTDAIYLIPADGSREADELITSNNSIYPASWTPDGMSLAFYEINPTMQRDIWIFSMKDRTAKPIIATQYNERVPMFSPDGRFIAYVSNDTGRDEIFIQPYPTTGVKWQISDGGGTEPMWAPNGKELYYRQGNKMMAVKLEFGSSLKWERARMLFEGNFASHVNYSRYHIHPKGDRFLMVRQGETAVVREIHVVFNWFEELKRLATTKK